MQMPQLCIVESNQQHRSDTNTQTHYAYTTEGSPFRGVETQRSCYVGNTEVTHRKKP